MISEARLALASLSLYRNLVQDPVIFSLQELLRVLDKTGPGQQDQLAPASAWGTFLYHLHASGNSFRRHLLHLVLHDDNPFSRAAEMSTGNDINPALRAAASQDLQWLHRLYELNFSRLLQGAGLNISLLEGFPEQEGQSGYKVILDGSQDVEAGVDLLTSYYSRYSRGICSLYRAFRWDSQEVLTGLACPDPIGMDELIGYQYQKDTLLTNTRHFLAGLPANNVLLYGSRGTGKSSMVKALLQEPGSEKLALVEVSREGLASLSKLVARLRGYSLRFILYIDDLSFEDYETEYKGLKAILEGSLEARPDNVLIYATSNRRHLVKEFFSDRSSLDEEIHARDTMEEKLSLADRFGLVITFPTPAKQLYLDMVESMVGKRGLVIERGELQRRALEWERSHNGPSGRTARQFVDSLAGV